MKRLSTAIAVDTGIIMKGSENKAIRVSVPLLQ